MCASSAPSLLLGLALFVGCGEADRAAPELASDIAIVRGLIHGDPATSPIEEVERVADDRPVLAARLLASGALPGAREQVTRVREATLTTEQGRTWQRRLERAYADRVRGLEEWHGYLEDAASDDAELLAATTALRRAQVAIVRVERELEEVVPLEPERAPATDEPAIEPPAPPRGESAGALSGTTGTR